MQYLHAPDLINTFKSLLELPLQSYLMHSSLFCLMINKYYYYYTYNLSTHECFIQTLISPIYDKQKFQNLKFDLRLLSFRSYLKRKITINSIINGWNSTLRWSISFPWQKLKLIFKISYYGWEIEKNIYQIHQYKPKL